MTEGISREDKDLIIQSIRKKNPAARILAFGSRIDGRFKKYSDMDIAIRSTKNLEFSKLSEFKEIFENSNISFKIDIVIHCCPVHFRRVA